MRNMRAQLYNMGGKIGMKVVEGLGEASIKISEQAMGKCIIFGIYEPRIPIEMLKENMQK